MAVILDQSNTTTNGSAILRRSDGNDNDHLAQGFLCGFSGTLDNIRISLSKSGSPTGNLTVKLYADSANTNPTGSALSTCSSTLDVSTVSSSQTEYTISFPNDYSLVSGTRYWYSITADYTHSNVNCINVFQNNSGDAYTSGNCNRSTDGSTWNNDQGTNDHYFKIYLTPTPPSAFFNFF